MSHDITGPLADARGSEGVIVGSIAGRADGHAACRAPTLLATQLACARSQRRRRLLLNQLEQDATCRFRMDKDVAIAFGPSLDVFCH